MPYRTSGSSALAPDEDDFFGDESDYSDDSTETTGKRGASALDDPWTAAARGFGSDNGKIIDFNQYRADHGLLDDRQDAAAKKALAGEKAATSPAKLGKKVGGIGAAKQAEKLAGGVSKIKNNVVGKGKAGKNAKGEVTGGKNAIKKYGPVAIIGAFLIGFMALFSMSNILAPFGLVNNLVGTFNFSHGAMNTRSRILMPRLITGGRNTSVVKTSKFGTDKFTIKGNMKKKMLQNNIYYDSKKKIMVYTDPTTEKSYGIVANDKTLATIPDTMEIKDASGQVKTVQIDSDAKLLYNDALDVNDDFFAANEKSTRTIKGRIAAWFDDVSEKFHQRINNWRNRHMKSSVDSTPDEIENNARQGGMPEVAGGDDDLNVSDTIEGENGKQQEVNKPARDNNYGDVDTRGESGALTEDMTPDQINKSLSARAKTAAARIGKVTSILATALQIGSIGCTALKALNSVMQTIVGLQKSRIMNYTTNIFEIFQKTQAGDGNDTLMAFAMDKLTKVVDKMSAFSSPAFAQVFSNDGNVIIRDTEPMAQELSVSHMTETAFGGSFLGGLASEFAQFGGAKGTYDACVNLQIATGAVSAVSELINLVVAVTSGGLGSLVGGILRAILSGAMLASIMSGITGFISSVLVPKVTDMFSKNFISPEGVAGAILGFVILSGINIYAGQQMQSGSGIAGTKSTVLAHVRTSKVAELEEARYARLTRSPFDPTSKYTFLGSIVNSVTPIAMSLSSSPLSLISNTASVVGSAFTSILPTAAADGEVKFKSALSDNCGSVSLITDSKTGEPLTCDAFGNEYFVTDLSTVNDDPAVIMDKASKYISKPKDVTLWHYVCYIRNDGTEVCHDEVAGNYTAELKNFTKGYYGDFSNFPNLEAKKKEGWLYDIHEEIFYEPYTGPEFDVDYQLMTRPADDDGETADNINPEIKDHSDLANFVVACLVRTSPRGQEDSRTSQYVMGVDDSTFGQILDTAIGVTPVAGSIIDATRSAKRAKNAGWINGENCNDYEYYSRYSEDQRWLEGAGQLESSAVAGFLDGYYEEYPLDSSEEGIIAQYSGQTKEEVELSLGILEYIDYIANYDPTDAGPLPVQKVEPARYVVDGDIIAFKALPDILGVKYVVYDDLRSRVKVA